MLASSACPDKIIADTWTLTYIIKHYFNHCEYIARCFEFQEPARADAPSFSFPSYALGQITLAADISVTESHIGGPKIK